MGPYGFKEWLHTCAEQEFGHSNTSGPLNALYLQKDLQKSVSDL